MKFKNSTSWQDWFLRRMLSWCCQQLDMKVGDVSSATFRNSRSAWGGAAYVYARQITVCVGRDGWFPRHGWKHGNGHQNLIADRLECLVWVTAHELAHVLQRDTNTRGLGGRGGSEASTEWHAVPVLDAFRASRDALVSEWNQAPLYACRPAISPVERRKQKALADLERWSRKLKLAQTKVRKLKARVAYYNRPAKVEVA